MDYEVGFWILWNELFINAHDEDREWVIQRLRKEAKYEY